jgi:1,2-diacylglycerol 3-beta-glucosyltransferase
VFAASLPCIYLFVFTLFSAATRMPPRGGGKLKFAILVPAHNEAAGIAATVQNLRGLNWPSEQFRVTVIADNCTDATADAARSAGAAILIREDRELRGKGYALTYGFEHVQRVGWADAVVVVDADSKAKPNLLEAFATAIERGASAVQAHYGVINTDASWRTRLMAIAYGAIHALRSRARERLGLSCGIRGNGWCVTVGLLQRVPYRAVSLTEDVEFGVELGLKGERIWYRDDARVDGEMVTSEHAARSQRQRWEGGRFKLISSFVPKLAGNFLSRPNRVCLDLALDLLVLPLSYIVLVLAGCALAAALAAHFLGIEWALWAALIDLVCLVAYVLRGWQLSGVGLKGLFDLARAPGFILWKLLLLVSGKRARSWVRTDREQL